MEKVWAERSGIGWVGKNSCLITKPYGSWVTLSLMFLDREVDAYDTPHPKSCGDCEACLPACPTDAFPAPMTVDARKCISYQSIENPGAVPDAMKKGFRGRIFGCDICQEVCPYNRAPEKFAEDPALPRVHLRKSGQKPSPCCRGTSLTSRPRVLPWRAANTAASAETRCWRWATNGGGPTCPCYPKSSKNWNSNWNENLNKNRGLNLTRIPCWMPRVGPWHNARPLMSSPGVWIHSPSSNRKRRPPAEPPIGPTPRCPAERQTRPGRPMRFGGHRYPK